MTGPRKTKSVTIQYLIFFIKTSNKHSDFFIQKRTKIEEQMFDILFRALKCSNRVFIFMNLNCFNGGGFRALKCSYEAILGPWNASVGVLISGPYTCTSNTEYIGKRANNKLWCLRRLKKFGADNEDLKDVYLKQDRSILEYAVPVWHLALKD